MVELTIRSIVSVAVLDDFLRRHRGLWVHVHAPYTHCLHGTLSVWYTSQPICSPSLNEFAPVGMIMNSWMAMCADVHYGPNGSRARGGSCTARGGWNDVTP